MAAQMPEPEPTEAAICLFMTKAAASGYALHYAADSTCAIGRLAVRRLLDAGALVNAVNASRNTALHLAALHNSDEIVVLLLKAKAAVNAIGCHGTPLHCTVRKSGQPDVARLLETIKALLGAGADIHAKFKSQSVLSAAATRGVAYLPVIRLLLARGARTSDLGTLPGAALGALLLTDTEAQRDTAVREKEAAVRERDEAQEGMQCVVCLQKPRAVLFMPCFHLAV